MGIPFVGRGGLSRSKEYQRKKAAEKIPDGYIHPKKAFTAGYLLLLLMIFGAAYSFDHPGNLIATIITLGSPILSWVLFYVGWQYDFLLFQQLPDIERPSKWMGVAIAFAGPVAAGIYWLSRPRGY